MITTGAASDSTYKKGFTLVYQTYTPASRYLTGAVDLLAKLAPQAKSIAIIHEKDKFSTDVVTALKKYAEDKGYKVPLFEGYDAATTDFAPFINKIPQPVGAIMGGGHFADTTTFAKQLYEKKVNASMIALLVAPPEPKFAELGEACISVVGSSQWEPQATYSAGGGQKGRGGIFRDHRGGFHQILPGQIQRRNSFLSQRRRLRGRPDPAKGHSNRPVPRTPPRSRRCWTK